jgi:hypothetical protein
VELPRWYYEKDRRERWTEEMMEHHKAFLDEKEEALEYRQALKAAKQSGELNENLEEDDEVHFNKVIETHAKRIREDKAAANDKEPVFTKGDYMMDIYRFEG